MLMFTLLVAVGSIILALISVISYLLTKSNVAGVTSGNQAVKDQLSSIDAKIQANQDAINAEKAALVEKEKNETNDSIVSDLNSHK